MDYTYTIIDSDATSNLQLQHFLEDYGDFACLSKDRNSDDGLNSILKYLPEIVFINLNDRSGDYFNMITELYQYMRDIPVLIGISRSKNHAYDALKHNFFDYWLMPYNEHEIRKTLLRLKKKMPRETVSQTICLKSYKDFQYLKTDEILYLKADNNATDFIMKDGRTISAYKTLKTFEDSLPENFVRIHQSYILNVNYVSRINYGKSICALKSGNTQLPFSKSYKLNIDSLKKILSKNTITTLN